VRGDAICRRQGAADYVWLPAYGVEHYSLTDAALVSALDMWSMGRVEGVPCESWLDEQGELEIRNALEPLRGQLLAALIRSVESNQLAAAVRGRELATSRLIPERTYISLSDLVDWLEVHAMSVVTSSLTSKSRTRTTPGISPLRLQKSARS
jgi:hypothetical protein